MIKMVFGLFMMMFATIAFADCPDNDNDGHPEGCWQEGKYIPSEDNCETVYNPDQDYPLRWTLSAITGTSTWVVDSTSGGLACNYDFNGDGVLDANDQQDMIIQTRGDSTLGEITPDQVGKIGDFDGDGVYRLATPITSQLDIPDFCQEEQGLVIAGAFLYYLECI